MNCALTLRIETSGTADKRIAALVKTEKPVSRHSDSNAYAYANFSRGFPRGAEPQRPFGAQVHPIQTPGNAHRRSETSGPTRKLGQRHSRFFSRDFSRFFCPPSFRRFGGAMEFHPLDSFERLQPTQKNSFADAFALSGNIQHEVVSINKINIGVSALQKKCAIARRLSAERVTSRVTHKVRFGFNNAAAETDMRQSMHQRFPDQKARQFYGINRQLAAATEAAR